MSAFGNVIVGLVLALFIALVAVESGKFLARDSAKDAATREGCVRVPGDEPAAGT